MSATPSAAASVRALAERYTQAWNDHDLEAVLAQHTPDTEHRLHGGGGALAWVGREACREVFAYLLQAWPDQRFDTHELTVTRDLYVARHVLTGTLAAPWEMAGRTYEPNGRQIAFEITDIMHCVAGRIRLKKVWIDGLAIHNQLT